jgi:hypothetical protein
MEQETKGDSCKILSDSDAMVDKITISWRLYYVQSIIAEFNCANIAESNTANSNGTEGFRQFFFS